jgi:hypothetical protein
VVVQVPAPDVVVNVPQAAPPDVRIDVPVIPVTLQHELKLPPEETTTEVVERDASGRIKKIKRSKKLG